MKKYNPRCDFSPQGIAIYAYHRYDMVLTSTICTAISRICRHILEGGE